MKNRNIIIKKLKSSKGNGMNNKAHLSLIFCLLSVTQMSYGVGWKTLFVTALAATGRLTEVEGKHQPHLRHQPHNQASNTSDSGLYVQRKQPLESALKPLFDENEALGKTAEYALRQIVENKKEINKLRKQAAQNKLLNSP